MGCAIVYNSTLLISPKYQNLASTVSSQPSDFSFTMSSNYSTGIVLSRGICCTVLLTVNDLWQESIYLCVEANKYSQVFGLAGTTVLYMYE